MASSARKPIALAAGISALLLAAALAAAACSGGGKAGSSSAGSSSHGPGATKILPERIIPAPKALLGVAGPQPDGTLWAVAGSSTVGLFEFDAANGRETGSMSVSQAARSVAENSQGIVAVALGTPTSGALEFLDGMGKRARNTVGLPAPAVQVVTASSGTDFYALTAWPTSASVTIVSSRGKILGSVPAPSDSVSIAADPQQGLVYVLQRNGQIDEIGLRGGGVESDFTVNSPGESIALSADGSTVYVLKGTSSVSNIAVVDVATEGIVKVLPAPSHCIELLVSPSGKQLYEVVGSPDFGNIQVFES